MMRYPLVIVSLAALAAAGGAAAQSAGASMSSPSTGSGAAGSSPVGMVLPSTVQWGSTAPTQPGHTITGDRGSWQRSYPPRLSRDERGDIAVAERDAERTRGNEDLARWNGVPR